jgi:hypothetical protein
MHWNVRAFKASRSVIATWPSEIRGSEGCLEGCEVRIAGDGGAADGLDIGGLGRQHFTPQQRGRPIADLDGPSVVVSEVECRHIGDRAAFDRDLDLDGAKPRLDSGASIGSACRCCRTGGSRGTRRS